MNADELNNSVTPEDDDIEIMEYFDEVLISKLDSLKSGKTLYKKYSEIYLGGVKALRIKNRKENPDWMSQSANSFREILYLLSKAENNEKIEKIFNQRLSKSLTEKKINEFRGYLSRLYNFFTDLTHHFSEVDITTEVYLIHKNVEIRVNPLSEEDYFKAIKHYKEHLKLLVTTALEIHEKIDDCVSKKTQDKDLVKFFFQNSRDAKLYFYSLVDESWAQWLQTNGFFSILKEPAQDISKLSYSLPELAYLNRIAEKAPSIVGKIINSTPISKAKFNPEVVDRFLRIAKLLPAAEIKTLLHKIQKEKWLELMADFNRSGYEYKDIVEKFKNEKDYSSINEVAKIVFSTRTKQEIDALGESHLAKKLFHLNDISESDIFEALTSDENDNKEDSLKLILETLTKLVTFGKEANEMVFSESEPFYLEEIDIFNLALNRSQRINIESDLINLIASAKLIIESLFTADCGNEEKLKDLYRNFIEKLPDSKTMYRLRLFAISICPKSFQKEIQASIFRVFEVGERYFEIENGAEYHQTLIKAFKCLDQTIQTQYYSALLKYFGESLGDKDREKWRRRDGLKILAFIKDSLSKDQIEEAEKVLGKLEPGTPHPEPESFGIRSGFVDYQSPVQLDEYTIPEIIENLKGEWSPAALNEKYEGDDFLKPRGPEGLAHELREDFKKRPDEYFSKLNEFFSREEIHPSYLYALLQEISLSMATDGITIATQPESLLELFKMIRTTGEKKAFEKNGDNTGLADWITLHQTLADLLVILLYNVKDSEFFKKCRESFLGLIEYFLSIKCSPDEKDESRDPLDVAANSVRGYAYKAFAQFAVNDGSQLGEDTKNLFSELLENESSSAIWLIIGQYLGIFYFRDKEFIKTKLKNIFSRENNREKLYFAAWEGYLMNGLYEKMFEDMAEYYNNAISTEKETYPKRNRGKDLDQSLAEHMAIAYVHSHINLDDSMFELFWNTPSENRHYHFAASIGRYYLTSSQASDEWLKEQKIDKQRFIDFWNWLLETDHPIEQKTFSGFGFWVSPTKEIMTDDIILEKMPITLKRSDGAIDWDYGLITRLPTLAKKNGEKTLEIISNYLINSSGNLTQNCVVPLFSIDREIKEALQTIYDNGDSNLKKKVESFIGLLVEKGSETFWQLKAIFIKQTP